MTRLTEYRPPNGHDESIPHLNINDFDAIGPAVDNTPGAVKRAASRLVRDRVEGRDGQQEVLLALFGKPPQSRRRAGTRVAGRQRGHWPAPSRAWAAAGPSEEARAYRARVRAWGAERGWKLGRGAIHPELLGRYQAETGDLGGVR
jgi:hypothetical protein